MLHFCYCFMLLSLCLTVIISFQERTASSLYLFNFKMIVFLWCFWEEILQILWLKKYTLIWLPQELPVLNEGFSHLWSKMLVKLKKYIKKMIRSVNLWSGPKLCKLKKFWGKTECVFAAINVDVSGLIHLVVQWNIKLLSCLPLISLWGSKVCTDKYQQWFHI